MNTNKIIYWISTGLLTIIMLFSASMYFFNHDTAAQIFDNLGYPTYLVYPLAVLKLLGLVAVWTRKSDLLKNWAYAGFILDTALALTAHLVIGDGGWLFSAIALPAAVVSALFERKL
ncbi:MAG: DoxX family protein [Bacteroidota bacterium]